MPGATRGPDLPPWGIVPPLRELVLLVGLLRGKLPLPNGSYQLKKNEKIISNKITSLS